MFFGFVLIGRRWVIVSLGEREQERGEFFSAL